MSSLSGNVYKFTTYIEGVLYLLKKSTLEKDDAYIYSKLKHLNLKLLEYQTVVIDGIEYSASIYKEQFITLVELLKEHRIDIDELLASCDYESRYNILIDKLHSILNKSKETIQDYLLRVAIVDYITDNDDRHFNNYGLIDNEFLIFDTEGNSVRQNFKGIYNNKFNNLNYILIKLDKIELLKLYLNLKDKHIEDDIYERNLDEIKGNLYNRVKDMDLFKLGWEV